jgi:hypothetical protein
MFLTIFHDFLKIFPIAIKFRVDLMIYYLGSSIYKKNKKNKLEQKTKTEEKTKMAAKNEF